MQQITAIQFPNFTDGLIGDIQSYIGQAQTYVDNAVWARNCYCLDTANVQVGEMDASGSVGSGVWSFINSTPWNYGSQLDHITLVATHSGQLSGTWAVQVQWNDINNAMISVPVSTSQPYTTSGGTFTMTAPAGATGLGYVRIFSTLSTGAVSGSVNGNIYAIPSAGGWSPAQAPQLPNIVPYVYPTGQTNDNNAKRLVDIEQALARLQFSVEATNPGLQDLGTQGAVTYGEVVSARADIAAVQASASALQSTVDDVTAKLAVGLPPTAAVSDAVTPVGSGDSSGALPTNPSGLSIEVTAYPIWKGYQWDSPKQYPDLGEVTISGDNGYLETRPILWINTYWAGLPPLATGWQLSLAPGVEATVTTYARS